MMESVMAGQAGPGAGDNNDCQNRCNGDAEYNTGIGAAGQNNAVIRNSLENCGIFQNGYQKQRCENVPWNGICPCRKDAVHGRNAGDDI